jgi:hypothetical protein
MWNVQNRQIQSEKADWKLPGVEEKNGEWRLMETTLWNNEMLKTEIVVMVWN